MRRFKKIVTLILAMIIMVSIIAGCGADKQTPVSSNTPSAPVQSSTTTQPTTSTAQPVNLKWAVWDISLTTYYQPLIDAYKEKNPNVNIEMVDLGSAEYMTVLATQLSGGGSDFDVVCIKDIPGYKNLVSKNTLEPVDTSKVDLSAYGGITDQIMYNGNLYALPFRSDFWVIFYNKDIFDKAGVPYPDNDMTFEEYDALARKVAKQDLGNEIYGTHYHTWRSTVQLFGILDGKQTIVDGKYDFTKPYYEMVLKQQKDGICQDYATIKTSSLHYSGAFAKGNIAMMNMGSWFIPTLIDKLSKGEFTEPRNWGIVKYPHAEGVEPGTTLATITSLSVTASSKNKEAAADFMRFVCGPEGAKVIATTGTFPAIRTDEVVDIIKQMDGFPKDANSAEALKTARTYLEMPLHEKSSEIEVVLNDAHDYIMTGTMTIDEGIAYMNEEVGKILSK